VRISSETAAGWERAIEREASTSIVFAPIDSPCGARFPAGIALSPVATTYQEGSDFLAAASARSSKIAAKGRCLTARTRMSSSGRSAANASR
jgi:hypothetical protein